MFCSQPKTWMHSHVNKSLNTCPHRAPNNACVHACNQCTHVPCGGAFSSRTGGLHVDCVGIAKHAPFLIKRRRRAKVYLCALHHWRPLRSGSSLPMAHLSCGCSVVVLVMGRYCWGWPLKMDQALPCTPVGRVGGWAHHRQQGRYPVVDRVRILWAKILLHRAGHKWRKA